jgi:hypothetical protein
VAAPSAANTIRRAPGGGSKRNADSFIDGARFQV